MISYKKLFALFALALALILLWDNPLMSPFRIFVVYLHEISHALGAIVTGGAVKKLVVNLNESGYTTTVGGSFFITAISGYIGSIVFGGMMLLSSLGNHFTRLSAIFVGCLLLLFTILFPSGNNLFILLLGICWGLAFLIVGFLDGRIAKMTLFFMGGLASLYGFYDLGDFFRGNIELTDAGILAKHYVGDSFLQGVVAYAIAIGIASISIFVLLKVVKMALMNEKEVEPEEVSSDNFPFVPTDKPLSEMTAEEFILLMRAEKMNREHQAHSFPVEDRYPEK
ncbi:MAG: M50 family peptidase [Candidatus Hydrogenedentota bacterium]|nr:MAG: M50 family peptidase [Candidatus Hydrogenedentota bacterium]